MLDDRSAENESQLKEVRDLLLRIVRGTAPANALGAPNTRFYVLGLSPNAGRVAVRFWFTDTLEALLRHLRQHLQDLDIIGLDPDAPPPVIRELLLETAREAKDIPPLLAGALLRSLLTGQPYPESFFLAVLRRVRLDGQVHPRRAAISKAHLNRLHRQRPFLKEPIPMALDPDRNDVPYVLGRLFAAYEKIQKEALGEKLNRTIKDSYLSSASASPSAVFPRLFRLSQHHLGKIENTGLRIVREKLLGDLYARFEEFPSHLSHHDQGLFAIGYYHQTQDFYTRKADGAERAVAGTSAA
jgi:CRISPR-associated protein Csd1